MYHSLPVVINGPPKSHPLTTEMASVTGSPPVEMLYHGAVGYRSYSSSDTRTSSDQLQMVVFLAVVLATDSHWSVWTNLRHCDVVSVVGVPQGSGTSRVPLSIAGTNNCGS